MARTVPACRVTAMSGQNGLNGPRIMWAFLYLRIYQLAGGGWVLGVDRRISEMVNASSCVMGSHCPVLTCPPRINVAVCSSSSPSPRHRMVMLSRSLPHSLLFRMALILRTTDVPVDLIKARMWRTVDQPRLTAVICCAPQEAVENPKCLVHVCDQ